MSETARQWHASPARYFSPSANLPGLVVLEHPSGEQLVDSHNHPGSLPVVNERLDSILEVVGACAEEYGRGDKVGGLYTKTVGERFGSLSFLSSTQDLSALAAEVREEGINLDDQGAEIKEALIHDIAGLNKMGERLFGAIDPERLAAMVARVRRSARELLAADDPQAIPPFKAAAARRLLEVLPSVPDEAAETHLYKPSAELLAVYKGPVEKKYGELFALMPADKQTYTGGELAALFHQAKDVMANSWDLAHAHDWVVGRGGTNISVSLQESTIWVPERQPDVSALKAKELLGHELGTHFLRNLLGRLTGDPFLATHMAGRDNDEEALGMFVQAVINGKPEESGVMHYVGIGLAQGILRDGQAMDPYQLQSVLTDMFAIKQKATQAGSEQNGLKAVSRLVTGMPSFVIDGKLRQVVHPGNIKYALGQAHAVKWFEAHKDNPGLALDITMVGKYAYSDPLQVAHATQKYAKINGRHRVPSAA